MSETPKTYLGIDYGHVRIGLAVGDSEAKQARRLKTIEKSADPTAAVIKVATDEAIDELIIGLPRNLESEDTIQTAAARAFAQSLTDAGYTVHLQDEAGTSSLAKERLREAGLTDKLLVDQEAAAIILQDWLDAL
jgi:putative Holliday junction resolvase